MTIWISLLMRTIMSTWPFRAAEPGEPSEFNPPEVVINPRRSRPFRIFAGECLQSEELPSAFCKQPTTIRSRQKPPPDVLNCEYAFIPEPVAAVMRDFDLAPGAPHPVTLYDTDTATVISDRHSILKFGCRTETVDRQRSEGVKLQSCSKDLYQLRFAWEKDKAPPVYRRCAPEGADLWVDLVFPRHFFVSDRLYRALKKAGKTSGLRLKPMVAP